MGDLADPAGPAAAAVSAAVPGPTAATALAPGRHVELPGRGVTFVRELDGPPGAPTVVLLHGWFATAGLNWRHAFGPLARAFRVVAPDLRGHGRGVRSRRRFRLADVADDTAALLEVLGTGPAVVVGYSMGGAVAQLLWRRHRHLTAGLVLCATCDGMVPGVRDRVVFTALMSAAAGTTRVGWALAEPSLGPLRRLAAGRTGSGGGRGPWVTDVTRRHDVRHLLEAGMAIGGYDARRWIGRIDVPTAVVVTTRDRAMPPEQQLRMARAIPGATVHHLDDGHVACARPTFAAPLVAACLDVASRLGNPSPA